MYRRNVKNSSLGTTDPTTGNSCPHAIWSLSRYVHLFFTVSRVSERYVTGAGLARVKL